MNVLKVAAIKFKYGKQTPVQSENMIFRTALVSRTSRYIKKWGVRLIFS